MNSPPEREEALFEAALQLPPEERAGYLDQACGGDAQLRQRVEALIRAHEHAGPFMAEPAVPPPGPTVHLSIPLTEKPGDKIGHYKLLQQIGEGGCGVVYMAEQEEPIRRRVAFKVIKLGMDTKQVIARFEAERQALALMDHPNIARVLDAGATETGRPFFVMELVRGIKITDYCDQNNLPTEQRLDLFIQVCHAIQHAHQKGIIHRDIKPSNILVTVNDGVPVPKVIDFGIAKATEQRLTDKTLFTAFEQFIGTPAYMSPEQAEMTSLDIDTRSDIYALGVLLYELLTGKTPFDAKELIAAGLDEMRRIIREQEPPRPSTRISTTGDPERTTVAQRRHVEAPKLIHQVRGELDWIVMKCLEKDRTRRYEAANGLALDIEHHLKNEPVTAAAPGTVYLARKFVRRHQAGMAMAAVILGLLVAGVVVSTWEAVRATRAERRARAEAIKSGQVAQFLKDMLEGVGPSVALGRDTKMLREILDKTAQRVGKDLKEQPEVEAELRSTIGITYYELGDWPKAEATHREALRLRKGLFGETNEFVASSLHNLGNVLWRQSRFAEGESLHRAALAIRRSLLGKRHPDVVNSLAGLAGVLASRGKLAEAEAAFREAIVIQSAPHGAQYPAMADLLNELVLVFMDEHKLAEAESASREAVALGRRFSGEWHPTLATSLLRLAFALEEQGKFAEAEPLCREAIAMRRKLLGNEHPYVASGLDRLASVLGRAGKEAEAIAAVREGLSINEKQNPDGAGVFTFRLRLGEYLLEQKEYAEAEPLLLTAYRGMRERDDKLAANRKPYLPRALRALVQLYEATRRSDEAAEWRKKLTETGL